ncbi:MAG: KpsF/GutQ family sugar-phosphate isomerase [Betaproteobacteria bacterium]|nr:KpsF/GutQ family sugar-phosphate isomerase [Betaproteobacteria bacterium]
MNTPKPAAGLRSEAQHRLATAREVLEIEAAAVAALKDRLGESFLAAVDLIDRQRRAQGAREGRVVVSGIGKSGHVARKIASTLASTGTPAFFVHPAEASHGDLGMVTPNDVFIAISNSGESEELLTIIPLIKRQGAKLIAMTGNGKSTLAREADVHLDAGVAKEACPLELAPTASTTAALALGDALAMVLLDAQDFTPEQFAQSHPGGRLGRRLLTHVRDVMRTGEAIPSVQDTAMLGNALLEISRKGLGMTAVLDRNGRVIGIYTDGDLRRTLEKTSDRPLDFAKTPVTEVMHRNPRAIGPDRLAVEAVQMMEQFKINQLLVLERDRLVGALNMHDLFRAKVI